MRAAPLSAAALIVYLACLDGDTIEGARRAGGDQRQHAAYTRIQTVRREARVRAVRLTGRDDARRMLREMPAPRLALNCVGGKSATELARHLGHGGTMVSYGAMGRAPISLPTSLFIFKDIVRRGVLERCARDCLRSCTDVARILDDSLERTRRCKGARTNAQ
jgi:NADPH:quinone reductase-like Zn-dependent oxidoreductase